MFSDISFQIINRTFMKKGLRFASQSSNKSFELLAKFNKSQSAQISNDLLNGPFKSIQHKWTNYEGASKSDATVVYSIHKGKSSFFKTINFDLNKSIEEKLRPANILTAKLRTWKITKPYIIKAHINFKNNRKFQGTILLPLIDNGSINGRIFINNIEHSYAPYEMRFMQPNTLHEI